MKKITLSAVRRAGQKDGRNWRWKLWPFFKTAKDPRPAQDQKTQCDQEIELKEAAQDDISKLSVEWEELDRKLRPNCDRLQAQVQGLEDQSPNENAEALGAKARYEQAEENLDRFLPPSMKPFWVYLWLAFLGIVEWPVNTLIFSLLADGQVLTYLMALVIFCIPLEAHFFGHALKQETKAQHDWLFLIVIPLLVFGCLIGFGVMRGQYLAAMLSRFSASNIGISPTMGTWLFIIFNVMIFGIACNISYFGSHPQHREYHKACRRYREALSNFERKNGEAKNIALQLVEARKSLAEAARSREISWKSFREKANNKAETGKFLGSAYRTQNMKWRPSAVKPPCFELDFLRAEIPQNLQVLDGSYPVPRVSIERESVANKSLLAAMLLLPVLLFPGAAIRHNPSKAVIVLLDLSESTNQPQKREAYAHAFGEILDKSVPGDAFVTSLITEKSVDEMDYVIKEEFPVFRSSLSGFLKKVEEEEAAADFKAKKDVLKKKVEMTLMEQSRRIRRTDIMSSLQVAERVLSDFPQPRKVLVILSDMIEDSAAYNFETEILSDERISDILANEKKRGRLPDLQGVHVYVAGAAASNLDRYYTVQKFWLAYFKECGAVIQKKDYGSVLLSLPE